MDVRSVRLACVVSEARAKTFVYPSELLKLAACPDVPCEWRELHAIACYLFGVAKVQQRAGHDTFSTSGCIAAKRAGFESEASVRFASVRVSSRTKRGVGSDVRARFAPDVGPIEQGGGKARRRVGPTPEDVIARALAVAVEAKRWDLVAQLTRELEALRTSRA
jgi:hypothetical protein